MFVKHLGTLQTWVALPEHQRCLRISVVERRVLPAGSSHRTQQNITKATLSEDEQSAYWLHKYTLRVTFHPETNEPMYDDTGLLVRVTHGCLAVVWHVCDGTTRKTKTTLRCCVCQ